MMQWADVNMELRERSKRGRLTLCGRIRIKEMCHLWKSNYLGLKKRV